MKLKRAPTERDIQAAIVKLYRRCGCKVYPTSQYRVSRQALGIPDLYVIHPHGGDWWHEVKAPGGKQSKEQTEFQDALEVVRPGTYVLGGLQEAQNELTWRGVNSWNSLGWSVLSNANRTGAAK